MSERVKNILRKTVAARLNKKKFKPWNEKIQGPEPEVIVAGKVLPKGGWRVIDETSERAAAIILSDAGLSVVEISNKLVCPPSIIAEYLGKKRS